MRLSHRLWLMLGWALVLAVLAVCLLPMPALPVDRISWSDKAEHALAFATLAWWFAVARRAGSWRLLAVLLVGYGGLIELLQGLTAYRTASLADALADAFGVGLGLLIARWSPAGFPPLTPAK